MQGSSSSYPTPALNLFRLATTNQNDAIRILSQESLFEQLSFEQILSIVGAHETLALAYLGNKKHWPVLDGLAISLLAQKNELVAHFVLSQPELCDKLVGLDLARIGQASMSTCMRILEDRSLCVKLKSPHLATLAASHADVAQFIFEKFYADITPNDLGQCCQNNSNIAQRLLEDNDLVANCDGSTLALIAQHHEALVRFVLTNPSFEKKLDSDALAILGRQFENMALFIYESNHLKEMLGPFGLARMAKHHERLAHTVLKHDGAQFSGKCFEQLGEHHESVALAIYEKHQDKMSLDEIVMLGKFHFSIAQKILLNQSIQPLLTGKHLVILGHHKMIAIDILKDDTLRAKVQGQNVGLLGLHDFEIAQRIMQDASLRSSLQTLDLANLCKNFYAITVLTLRSWQVKMFSPQYCELLTNRMEAVVSVCSFIQNSFMNEQVLQAAPLAIVPQYQATLTRATTPPPPNTDPAFVAKFQNLHF